MAKKKALITGIAGQDGSYLAEFLLAKGYEVHGTVTSLSKKADSIEHIKEKLVVYECDATDREGTGSLVREILPDEIYHLAATATASISPDTEYAILHNNLSGVHNILSAARDFSKNSKVFFAGSSLIFGVPQVFPQNENTPINPHTPYGIAKAAGYYIAKMYRESFGVFACTGILFNHESPRRSPEFVTRKITSTASKIKKGLEKELWLGNLEAKKDWGFAGDHVEAMWLMLQEDKPQDFVIGTGESHSVQEFVEKTFNLFGLDSKEYVKEDPKLKRPMDANVKIIADIGKAKKILGWEPKTSFDSLVRMMAKADGANI